MMMNKPENTTSNSKLRHMIRNVSQDFRYSPDAIEESSRGRFTPDYKPILSKKKRNHSLNSQTKQTRNAISRDGHSNQNLTNDITDAHFLDSTLNNTLYIEQSIPHVLNEIQQSIGVLKKFYQDLSKRNRSNRTPIHNLNDNTANTDDYRSNSPRKPKVDLETLQKEYEKVYHRKANDIQALYDFYTSEYLDRSKSTSILRTPDKTRPSSSFSTSNQPRSVKNENQIQAIPLSFEFEENLNIPPVPPNTPRVSRKNDEMSGNLKLQAAPKEKRSSSTKANSTLKKNQQEELTNVHKRQRSNEHKRTKIKDLEENERSGSPIHNKRTNLENFHRKSKSRDLGIERGSPIEHQDVRNLEKNQEIISNLTYGSDISKILRQKYLPSKQPKKFKKTATFTFSGKKLMTEKPKTPTGVDEQNLETFVVNEKNKDENIFSKIFEKNMLINKLKKHINQNLLVSNSERNEIQNEDVQKAHEMLFQLQQAKLRKIEQRQRIQEFSFTKRESPTFDVVRSSKQKINGGSNLNFQQMNTINPLEIINKQKELKRQFNDDNEIFLNSYDLSVVEDLSKMIDMIANGKLPMIENNDDSIKSFDSLRKKIHMHQNEIVEAVKAFPIEESLGKVAQLDSNDQDQTQTKQLNLSDLESILDNSTSLVIADKHSDKYKELFQMQRHFLDGLIDEGEFLKDLQKCSADNKVTDSINYSQELDLLQGQFTQKKDVP